MDDNALKEAPQSKDAVQLARLQRAVDLLTSKLLESNAKLSALRLENEMLRGRRPPPSAPTLASSAIPEIPIWDHPDLSVRARNALQAAGFSFLSEVAARITARKLAALPNIGAKTVREIAAALAYAGLELRE